MRSEKSPRRSTQGSTCRPLSGDAGSSDATAQGRASGSSAPRATRRRPRPANPNGRLSSQWPVGVGPAIAASSSAREAT
ncbi:hypothetical protein WMF27_05155 [Sorangium sp. So ce281]|uniref:hypothetical protein n=1 Tax=unclassified Sorangium TaxID=2621164 RepID=UPI003F5D9E2B